MSFESIAAILIALGVASLFTWLLCREKPVDSSVVTNLQKEREEEAKELNSKLDELNTATEVLSKVGNEQSKRVDEIMAEAKKLQEEAKVIPGSMSNTTIDEKKKELEKHGFKTEDF